MKEEMVRPGVAETPRSGRPQEAPSAWSGDDLLKLAQLQGALQEGLQRAAILRSESVTMWASQARELVAWAKRRSDEIIGDEA